HRGAAVTILPMLLAATGIGIGHAILPDHWMPLALLARTRNYPPRRTARLALAAAVTHVVVSVLLGTALAAVGLRFRETVAQHAGMAVGGVLMATGVVLAVMEVMGRGHQHAHLGHEHEHACDDDHVDPPATALLQLPAQAARRSGRSTAVLERPIATLEPESHHSSAPLLGPAARSAAHAPRRDLPLSPGPAVPETDSPYRSLPPQPGPAAHPASRRSLLPLPGRATRSETDSPRRSPLPLLGRAAHPASCRSLLPLPGRASRSEPDSPRRRNLLTLLAPFGAAASPDLTILPLFLTAGALGVGPALGVLAAFSLATVAVMVGLTLAAASGARRLTAPWIEERATLLTAATLLVIGVLVVGGAL
ncbi:hypothetical protein, partial [Catenulispora rubra]|uniref:hypothetical protein n=1 Tax=Catenulispora rubra TaxID=280293 RepID=UPI001E5A29E3